MAKKSLLMVEVEKIKNTKIKVVGIGGGGCSIISEIAPGIKKATFIAANTDLRALKEVNRKVERFPFGQSFTHGLGTGMNPELGEVAAQNDRERIKNLLKGQDLVILIACLGSGTSSGAAPIFAKISRSLGNFTYGIFTLPFKFEGEKKIEIAKIALEKLKPKLNAITLIPNERIFQIIDKATPLKGALSAINKTLSESLEGLLEVIYQPGLINIDFADLKTILHGRGRLAFLNTAWIQKKKGSGKEAIEKVLNSPLYPYSIRGAKGVLFNIAGEKNLSLEEVSQISKTISELSNPEAKIIFGISHTHHGGGEAKYKNLIKITLLATGCLTKIFSPKRLRPKDGSSSRLAGSSRVPTHHRPTTGGPLKRQRKKIIPKSPTPPAPKRKFRREAGGLESQPIKKKLQKLRQKLKIKISKKPKEVPQSKTETSKTDIIKPVDEKIRKNALQIKREIEEAEKEILEKEKFWETPAFLRKKLIRGQ
ncbi:MAG: hypothetical protein CO078_01860 [Candidatus Nealsonbacteria bacterium CG_4_9_14_0_8_um_filter_36_17]|uniref:Cell division protein FtsZ n=1 Tax=Candidatus Nealsonbacteria bacterium CG_4_9_14_0_8_um_filter_36_17 TaxID=1974693 RepID=A0A2M8DL47_9BACT|nr:MAG: hypothetical protein CO078_01860 [Candidatus Nealsonbacteria bacterium CG_4_9_14_0_8_um_filter_36_17]